VVQRGSSRWFSRQGSGSSQISLQAGSAQTTPAKPAAQARLAPVGKLGVQQPQAAAAAVQAASEHTGQGSSNDQVQCTSAASAGEVRLLISNPADAQQKQKQVKEQPGTEQQQQQQQVRQLSQVAAGDKLTSQESLELADATAAAAVAAAELAHAEEQWQHKQTTSAHRGPFKFLSTNRRCQDSSSVAGFPDPAAATADAAAPTCLAGQASSEKDTSFPAAAPAASSTAAAGEAATLPDAGAMGDSASDAGQWDGAGAAALGRFG
jgi:hypothetical protein